MALQVRGKTCILYFWGNCPFNVICRSVSTHLQTLIRLEFAQILLQEQQVDAEVVVEGRHHAQSPEARQQLIRSEEVGALASRSNSSIHHQRSEKYIHPKVDVAEQPEDPHCYELTLHRSRHHAVVLQHPCTQVAGELIGQRGQADVVAEEDAGQQEGEQSQAPT